MPEGNIGSWDMTTLVRVIRDILEQNPTQTFQQLTVDDLNVVRRLLVADEVLFTKNANYVTVGGTGAPAFANSWVNWGAPYFNAAYWKDPLGFVHLRGVIQSGVVGSAAFTLPPGFRPAGTVLLATISNNAIGRVEVANTGTVTPISPSSNVWVSLDGLYYKAS